MLSFEIARSIINRIISGASMWINCGSRSVLLAVLAVVNCFGLAHADDADIVLELLDARRSIGDSGFSWSFEYVEVTLPPLKVSSVEEYASALDQRARSAFEIGESDTTLSFVGAARWDSDNARYWFSAEHIQKWVDGKAPYVAMREQIGFDGQATWDLQTVKPGVTLPLEDFTKGADPEVDWFPNGNISAEMPSQQRLQQLLVASGYWFRPGYFALPDSREWGASVDIAGFLRELKKTGRNCGVSQ